MSPVVTETDRRVAMAMPRPFPALYRRAWQVAVGGRKYRHQVIRRFVLQPGDVVVITSTPGRQSVVVEAPSVLVVRQHPTDPRRINLWTVVADRRMPMTHVSPSIIRGARLNGDWLDLPVGRGETRDEDSGGPAVHSQAAQTH